MKDLEEVPTSLLWAKIEKNAQLGQTHLDWELYLIRIKVLIQMIERRIKLHQKQLKEAHIAEEQSMRTISGRCEICQREQ